MYIDKLLIINDFKYENIQSIIKIRPIYYSFDQ